MKNWQIPFRNDSYQMALGIVQDTKERILCTRDATYHGCLAEHAEIVCTEENGVLQICCRLLLKSDLYADRLFLRLGYRLLYGILPAVGRKVFSDTHSVRKKRGLGVLCFAGRQTPFPCVAVAVYFMEK